MMKWYFNPLSPCGERPNRCLTDGSNAISIHSLRVEGDSDKSKIRKDMGISIRSPEWRETCRQKYRCQRPEISIHSPEWERHITIQEFYKPLVISIRSPPSGGRHPLLLSMHCIRYFNPLPKYRETYGMPCVAGIDYIFQSTLSM